MADECFFCCFCFPLSFAGNNQNSWGKLGNIFGMRVSDHERMI